MKMNKLLLLIPFILSTAAIVSCGNPNNDTNSLVKETFTDNSIKTYYDSISISKNNPDLKKSLNSLIKTHRHRARESPVPKKKTLCLCASVLNKLLTSSKRR